MMPGTQEAPSGKEGTQKAPSGKEGHPGSIEWQGGAPRKHQVARRATQEAPSGKEGHPGSTEWQGGHPESTEWQGGAPRKHRVARRGTQEAPSGKEGHSGSIEWQGGALVGCRSISFPRARMCQACSGLHLLLLEPSLTHSRCSVNANCMNISVPVVNNVWEALYKAFKMSEWIHERLSKASLWYTGSLKDIKESVLIKSHTPWA